jgi:site-specific recombinase XerD
MLEQFFTYGYVLARLRGGALGGILDDVAAHLKKRGHTPRVGQSYLCAAGHFSHWLDLKRISPNAVGEVTIASFLEGHLPRCKCRGPHGLRCHMRAALDHVLTVLRAQGVATPLQRPEPTPLDRILDAFKTYRQDTCGASEATSRGNVWYVRRFLVSLYGTGEIDLRRLGPKELIGFVLEQTRKYSPGAAGLVRTALRSFLRFAQVAGLCEGTLVAAVPKVAHWRQANLPRGLSDEQLTALLTSFDLTTATGRRDYAMVSCMAGLGLRAGEVAALLLDDVDWRAGTLRVGRGKERRASVLPLPAPVGRALVDYLRRGRPHTDDRHMFVRHQLPVGQPLSSSAVTAAVRLAFTRARLTVPFKGAHVLRHTAATRMVRAGASLKQVADVLRHRSLETTAIYAKVDLATLTEVALPWPEVDHE